MSDFFDHSGNGQDRLRQWRAAAPEWEALLEKANGTGGQGPGSSASRLPTELRRPERRPSLDGRDPAHLATQGPDAQRLQNEQSVVGNFPLHRNMLRGLRHPGAEGRNISRLAGT